MRTLAALLGILVAVPSALAGALPADPSTADVCALLPGDRMAVAAGGRLVEASLVRPEGHHARCRYTVAVPEGKAERRDVYLVWLHAAADFAELRDLQEGPAAPVAGLGDEAFAVVDPDTGRHGVLALLRGLATVEVTAPTAAGGRAVAATAVDLLRRQADRP